MINNKYGDFGISPKGEFRACTYTTIKMSYTVGKEGLAVGGVLKIGLPNMGWGEPLTPYPRGCWEIYKGKDRQICRYKKCNTTYKIENSNKADIYLSHRGSQVMLGKYNNWSWWITATVELEPLLDGDKIIITYGDTVLGEKGVLVQPWAEKDRIWFSAFVDCKAEGHFEEVPGSPVECSVIPGPPDKCIITIPSIIHPEEKFGIKTSLTDWGNNPVINPEASEVKILDSEENAVKSANLFKNSPINKIKGITSNKNCFYEIEVKANNKQVIKGKSNPAICSKGNLNLYWGDLHTHSFYHQYNEKLGYGDPCTCPDELLKYAKEVTHLDFAALTDGRGALPDNAGWQEAQQAVIDNYAEGEFVTLKGWEVQMGLDGHRNAIYKDAVIEPNIDAEVFKEANIWGDAKGKGMQGALDYYKGRDDVMLIPHHSLVWMNWDCYDENLDRLVEIYSCWGSSEYPDNDMWSNASPTGQSVRDALARGYKLGFVGGSDSHTGYPGRSIPDADRYKFVCYKSGYTGVYSKKLNRESIFKALRNRQCYATTGARIIVEFFVDGKPMGSIISENEKKEIHTVSFSITGTDRIRSIEIIRDGETIHIIQPYTECFKDEWIDKSNNAKKASYYYLRITQVDGNRAWSSPVWV